jgi:hypothetical protein
LDELFFPELGRDKKLIVQRPITSSVAGSNNRLGSGLLAWAGHGISMRKKSSTSSTSAAVLSNDRFLIPPLVRKASICATFGQSWR